jgi:hypothetical protein
MPHEVHSMIPYVTGEDARFVHQTEGGFLSVERNDAGEIANVVRLMNLDARTCLFSEADIDALSTHISEQEIIDFPGLDVDPKGWKAYHADKRLNGPTFALRNKEDGTFLSIENGVESWITTGKDQYGNVAIPTPCVLSEDEQLHYQRKYPQAEVVDYTELQLDVLPMMEHDNGDVSNAESEGVPAQWYTTLIMVNYDSGILPPADGNELIHDGERLHSVAAVEAKIDELIQVFPYFDDHRTWSTDYVYDPNLPDEDPSDNEPAQTPTGP